MYKYLYFELDDFYYLRLQSLIWAKNGLKEQSALQLSAVELLECVLSSQTDNKPLVINCKRVKDISDKSFDNFLNKYCKDNHNRKIVFINCADMKVALIDTLTRNGISMQSDDKHIATGNTKMTMSIDSMIKKIDAHEDAYIKTSIASCYSEFESGLTRLASTPVLASGEFDAAKIISDPKKFLWVSNRFADLLDDFKLDIEKERRECAELKLLAVSLRAAPFASAIGLLTNTGYDVVDHLGPKHELLDFDFLSKIKKNVMYIYVGDFIIGGTEVKIAQTYAKLNGCFLDHAIVLGTLLDNSDYESSFKLKSLVAITEAVPEVRFCLLQEKMG